MLQTALQGGSATASFFGTQNAIGLIAAMVKSDPSLWVQSTDGAGNPTWTATLKLGILLNMAMTLSTTPQTDVINGTSPPVNFEWNGNSYNIVGTFEGTVTYNDSAVATIQVPVGLFSGIAVTALSGYAWSGLVVPLLKGFLQGVQSCFSQADSVTTAEEAAEASEEAADEAAVEETAVEGVEVSLETGGAAFVVIVVLVALQYLLGKLDHTTYHNLRVYNLTPYQITWQSPAIDNQEATMISMPVSGDGSGAYDYVIPPLSSITPPGGDPVQVATDAGFAFASTSGYEGFAYVLPFTLSNVSSGETMGAAAALFDLPWGANNSLYGSFEMLNPQELFSNWDGVLKQTLYTTQTTLGDGTTVTMTMTYDYISGEQTAPSGQPAYFYNSLLVFSVGSASA